jgi:hypothetical protein
VYDVKKGQQNRDIMRELERIINDGEWHSVHDLADELRLTPRTMGGFLKRYELEKKEVRALGVTGSYYRKNGASTSRTKIIIHTHQITRRWV